MDMWFKAFSLGMQILTAIKNVKEGQPAQLGLEWRGKFYKLSLEIL